MPISPTVEDWRAAVGALSGLANMRMTAELAKEIEDIRWYRYQHTWSVERASVMSWLQDQLEEPACIAEVFRRLISEGLISRTQSTSREGQTVRVHTLNGKRLAWLTEELWNAN